MWNSCMGCFFTYRMPWTTPGCLEKHLIGSRISANSSIPIQSSETLMDTRLAGGVNSSSFTGLLLGQDGDGWPWQRCNHTLGKFIYQCWCWLPDQCAGPSWWGMVGGRICTDFQELLASKPKSLPKQNHAYLTPMACLGKKKNKKKFPYKHFRKHPIDVLKNHEN